MSRIIVDAVRNSSASSDGITLASDGSVTIPGNATCSGTATGFGGGKLLQVIQTEKNDTTSTSSTSWSDITGMSVTITPSSSSSKIFVETRFKAAAGDVVNTSVLKKLIKVFSSLQDNTIVMVME